MSRIAGSDDYSEGGPRADTVVPRGECEPHSEIDWKRALHLSRKLARQVRTPAARAEADDVANEALLRVVREVRRGRAVQSLDAFVTLVTKRVAVDAARSRRRWNAVVVSDNERSKRTAAPKVELGDPLDRARFIVLGYFERTSTECFRLASAFFDEVPWPNLAQTISKKPEAVRQTWKRCLDRLRESVREDPAMSPLADWAAERRR